MSNERIFDSFYPLVSADRIKLSWNFQRCWRLVRWKHIKKLAKLFKAWQLGTCPKQNFWKNSFFSGKMTVFTRWVEVTEIQHIYENHIHCSNFGTLAGGQKSKNRKMFVFFGTKFCSLKMTSQDFKNSYHPDLFFSRFKICNLILPSLLGNGKINMYFQRFWGFFFDFFKV